MKHNVFAKKIGSFEALLMNRPDSITVSSDPYCQQYFMHLVEHRTYFLNIYADLLQRLWEKSRMPIHEITMVDMGSGNGLFGLFASYCGFKVYINDLNGKFIAAAKELASALGISIEGFIESDALYLGDHLAGVKPDIIAATDAIEHIYDPGKLLKALNELNPDMVVGFTTASNPYNFYKMAKLRRLQKSDELKGSQDGSVNASEQHPAYLEMRKQIIAANSSLTSSEISRLAFATRGLNEPDILKAILEFQRSGKSPVPADNNNTCHPLTGSWTERILPIRVYRSMFLTAGFMLEVYPGFYDEFSVGKKKFFNKIVNRIFFNLGKFFAPYIILIGHNTKGKRV
jgi:hypothetical protein